MNGTDTTTATPLPTLHERFAAKLRALADVIETHPELRLPLDVSVSAMSSDDIDRWAVALTHAGHDVTDRNGDHHREVYSNATGFRICKVHDEPMRRHYAEVKFLADHAAEVDAQIVAPSVPA